MSGNLCVQAGARRAHGIKTAAGRARRSTALLVMISRRPRHSGRKLLFPKRLRIFSAGKRCGGGGGGGTWTVRRKRTVGPAGAHVAARFFRRPTAVRGRCRPPAKSSFLLFFFRPFVYLRTFIPSPDARIVRRRRRRRIFVSQIFLRTTIIFLKFFLYHNRRGDARDDTSGRAGGRRFKGEADGWYEYYYNAFPPTNHQPSLRRCGVCA